MDDPSGHRGEDGVSVGSVWAHGRGPGARAVDGEGFVVVVAVVPGGDGARPYCLAKFVNDRGSLYVPVGELTATCERVGQLPGEPEAIARAWEGPQGIDVRGAALELCLTWLDGRGERA